jgi:hypothetical protein
MYFISLNREHNPQAMIAGDADRYPEGLSFQDLLAGYEFYFPPDDVAL